MLPVQALPRFFSQPHTITRITFIMFDFCKLCFENCLAPNYFKTVCLKFNLLINKYFKLFAGILSEKDLNALAEKLVKK